MTVCKNYPCAHPIAESRCLECAWHITSCAYSDTGRQFIALHRTLTGHDRYDTTGVAR